MTNRSTTGAKAILVLVVLALGVAGLAAARPASANERDESGGDVPFYARITTLPNPDEIYQDDGWVAIVFYRPPACVRETFNLLDFFDAPAAFSCGPPTTEGFSIRRDGEPPTVAPRQATFRGLGDVPVWFVASSELAAGVADGVLTIGELEGMSTLKTGSASFFHQTLHPHEGANQPMTQFVASGELADGQGFRIQAVMIDNLRIATHITFR